MYVFLEFAAVNDKIKILRLYEQFFSKYETWERCD